MRKVTLITILGLSMSAFGQTPIAPTTVPYNDVTHKNKTAAITTKSGLVLEGKVNYNEYGDGDIHFFQEGKDPIHFETVDTLVSMAIAGRGVFEAVSVNNSEYKTMALVLEDTDGYKIYQKCSAGQGLLGYKISGGNLQGEYLLYLYHKRKNVMYAKKDVKKIEKTIGEYIDYCDEITEKVAKKEKGYKANLMKPDFDVLKKAILESETTCP